MAAYAWWLTVVAPPRAPPGKLPRQASQNKLGTSNQGLAHADPAEPVISPARGQWPPWRGSLRQGRPTPWAPCEKGRCLVEAPEARRSGARWSPMTAASRYRAHGWLPRPGPGAPPSGVVICSLGRWWDWDGGRQFAHEQVGRPAPGRTAMDGLGAVGPRRAARADGAGILSRGHRRGPPGRGRDTRADPELARTAPAGATARLRRRGRGALAATTMELAHGEGAGRG
jgi:hypothetical protein